MIDIDSVLKLLENEHKTQREYGIACGIDEARKIVRGCFQSVSVDLPSHIIADIIFEKLSDAYMEHLEKYMEE
jgi:hypothetical protein